MKSCSDQTLKMPYLIQIPNAFPNWQDDIRTENPRKGMDCVTTSYIVFQEKI